jgi:hypothetical protein
MSSAVQWVNIVYEDVLTQAVMERMMAPYGERLLIRDRIPCHGFGKIKANIRKYNRAAVHIPFFVITDLDRGTCAPDMIRAWIPEEQADGLLFRIAVREVESWIMADRNGFAGFIGVAAKNIPDRPDELIDPKSSLFSIVHRSRNRELKAAILPAPNARTGPGYNMVLQRFVRDFWDVSAARTASPSLEKALMALGRFLRL